MRRWDRPPPPHGSPPTVTSRSSRCGRTVRVSTSCAGNSPGRWVWRRSRSGCSTSRGRAATGTTAPTTSRSTRRCSRSPCPVVPCRWCGRGADELGWAPVRAAGGRADLAADVDADGPCAPGGTSVGATVTRPGRASSSRRSARGAAIAGVVSRSATRRPPLARRVAAQRRPVYDFPVRGWCGHSAGLPPPHVGAARRWARSSTCSRSSRSWTSSRRGRTRPPRPTGWPT